MTVEVGAELWPMRIAALAELGRVDGLAVVLRPRDDLVTYAAHNIAPNSAWDGASQAALLESGLDGVPSDGPVDIPLLDGRSATAMCALPIAWRDHRIGVLAALRTAPFAEGDAATLGKLAALIALELVEENAFWGIQRAASELEARTRASSELREIVRAERDPDALLARATSGLARVFGADGVSIMLIECGVLSVRSSVGLPDVARRDRKRVGEGISGFVAQTRQPLLLRGPVIDDRRFSGNDPTIADSLIAPLRNGEHISGVVSVRRQAGAEAYGTADLDALVAIGVDIAATLSFVGAVTRAEEDRKQAIALYELSRLGALGVEPQQALEIAIAVLGDVTHDDVVGLWVRSADGTAERRAGRGYDAGAPIVIRQLEGPFVAALDEQRSICARIESDHPAPPAWASPIATEYVLAPVAAGRETSGVLVLGRALNPYSNAEADFVLTAAEHLFRLVQSAEATPGVAEQATASERKRIAQELHDGLAQELTGVVMSLEGAQRALERNPRILAEQLAKATRDSRATLADVRQYMGALRESEPGELGLPTTVARLLDDLKRQTAIDVIIRTHGNERELEPDLQRAVIRIVGEALRNVAQHSGARHATVALTYAATEVVVAVTDDGAGFDAEAMIAEATAIGHFGLIGMRERAEAVGGRLVVTSAPGSGAKVEAIVPYERSAVTIDALRAGLRTTVPAADPRRPGFLARLVGR